MKKLLKINKIKEICMEKLIGEVNEEARVESAGEILRYARNIAE